MKAVPDTPSRTIHGAAAWRRWVSLCVGLALSVALAYLAMRSVLWSDVWLAIRQAQYRFLALAAFGTAVTLVLRAWRWGVILGPVQRVGAWRLFAITAVGFLAIIAVPFRMGELMRPYLLRDREGIAFSTGLATIAAERCLDGLAFTGLVVLAIPSLPLPAWAGPAGYALAGSYVLGLAVLVVVWLARDTCVRRLSSLCRRVTPGLAPTIERVVAGFLGGLAFLPGWTNVGLALLLSGAIWLLGTVVNYVSFSALGLDLPWSAAAALQILVTIGVVLPAAPGFVGSFQYFAMMALSLYGVGAAAALSYAILIHATVLAVYIALGVICGLALQVEGRIRVWNLSTPRDATCTPKRAGSK